MTDPTPPAPNYTQPQPYAAYPGYPATPVARTNTLAIVSLVLSLVGVSIGGIVCGHLALSQIKRTGEAGHGLALAGVIIGYVFAAFAVLYVVGMIVFIIWTANLGTLSSPY